jgi:hypothetical protein
LRSRPGDQQEPARSPPGDERHWHRLPRRYLQRLGRNKVPSPEACRCNLGISARNGPAMLSSCRPCAQFARRLRPARTGTSYYPSSQSHRSAWLEYDRLGQHRPCHHSQVFRCGDCLPAEISFGSDRTPGGHRQSIRRARCDARHYEAGMSAGVLMAGRRVNRLPASRSTLCPQPPRRPGACVKRLVASPPH